MAGEQVAYIRVSTTEQNTDRQLKGQRFEKTFTDKVSGRSRERPALKECFNYLRSGDTLHVHSIDRLARSMEHLLALVRELKTNNISLKFHTENLSFDSSTSKPMSDLMLQIFGAIAQFERSIINERQREGIEAAKAKGVYKGGKPKLTTEQVENLKGRVDNGETIASVARSLGVTRNTIYRAIKSLHTHIFIQYSKPFSLGRTIGTYEH